MEDTALAARRREAASIVSTYTGWSGGASFIPVPYVDMAAVTLVQIKMVADLSDLYGVPFSRNVVKSIIAGLVGSLAPISLARVAASWVKSVPGVGTILGVLTAPVFTTASTYAIGKVFIQHFEAGGNVLNFDAEAMREHFKSEFEAGVEKAKGGEKAAA